MTDKENIKNIVELFIAWNGETEAIDVANIDSAVDFISDSLQEESVSDNLEEACQQLAEKARIGKAKTISPFFSQTDYTQGVKDGAKWKKEHLWKPANGDDLPEIDIEVIALLNNGKVVFAHRPHKGKYIGKSLTTGNIEAFENKTYGDGGWNVPHVVWWLDIELPKEK